MAEGNSTDYYRARELKERQIAELAIDPGIAAIHRDMADRYSRLLTGDDAHWPDLPRPRQT